MEQIFVRSTMSFKGLVHQGSLDNFIQQDSFKKKKLPWRRCSMNDRQLKNRDNTSAGSLRGRKQVNRTRSNSLVDYSDPQRTTLHLEKQDNEVFGFEVQTYGLQLTNTDMVEMCTFVCSVKAGSAAEMAGLTSGDIIVTINGVSIEGSSHQHIIDLIRNSKNVLKMETVSGSVVKRIELEKKMHLLKQTLREKWVELQKLTQQEKLLTRGNQNNITSRYPSVESLMSLASPTVRPSHRFSSDSSCRSLMTDDSEDWVSISSEFEDGSPFSPVESVCFFPKELQDARPPLTRTSSISMASRSGSLSPSLDNARPLSMFGTLPRRGRKGSVRKHILKFIPGLHHSVEEEENTRVPE
ncbi:cytohesin-interacting protein [Chanos chanos]|uniref:Cytohesin-interacting protein n=1 Tax=Chanos chanos TaxID=29144 RepID=A0A6J2WFD5_CHACN|nr:cytohesin-interacting protein [Chanos chanos]